MTEAETRAAVREDTEHVDRLVLGLRASSPEAQGELCGHYGPRIHRYLAHRLGQRDDAAEDLTVETLVAALRSIRRFDPQKATLTAWLFGIARRKAQVDLRRRRRRSSVPESAQTTLESLAERPAPGDLAGESVARVEAQRQVSKLVGCLSETEMEVLVLRCLHRLSVKEIGQVIGRSERAIDSLLHRAKRKARERLADDAGTV